MKVTWLRTDFEPDEHLGLCRRFYLLLGRFRVEGFGGFRGVFRGVFWGIALNEDVEVLDG